MLQTRSAGYARHGDVAGEGEGGEEEQGGRGQYTARQVAAEIQRYL